MTEPLFRLYWLDTRNGAGYPAKDYPEAMPFEKAQDICQPHGNRIRRPRHRDKFSYELRYEPLELFEKHTSKHPAV